MSFLSRNESTKYACGLTGPAISCSPAIFHAEKTKQILFSIVLLNMTKILLLALLVFVPYLAFCDWRDDARMAREEARLARIEAQREARQARMEARRAMAETKREFRQNQREWA